jgi:hypothetical protein
MFTVQYATYRYMEKKHVFRAYDIKLFISQQKDT